MGPETEDVAEFVLWFCWLLLSTTTPCLKNLLFDTIFPSKEIMSFVFFRSSLQFASGLLFVLKSKTPPTIAYFKALPKNFTKNDPFCWAVYLLVLEKEETRPRIYVGSGTDAVEGVKRRFELYDKLNPYTFPSGTPYYVKAAVEEGYTITSKGVLVWCDIPHYNHRFTLRALMKILENVFTLYFWALMSREKDYYMPNLKPWATKYFEYDGCCSHMSIKEGISGSPAQLTIDELAALDADRLEIKRAYDRQWKANLGPGVHAALSKATRDRAMEAQKYKCIPCKQTYPNQAKLDAHKRTETHNVRSKGITKIPQGRGGSQKAVLLKKYFCEECQHAASTPARYTTHMNGVRHAKKLRILKAEAEAASGNPPQ